MSAARMLTRVLKVPGLTTPRDVAALFPKTADEVVRTAEEVRDNVKANVATLLASEPSGFDSAWAVDVATADFSSQTAALSVVKSVAVDKEVRDAATKAIVELQALAIDLFSGNRDMYRWLKKIPAAAMRAAGPQEAYWLDEKLADYEREGHGLPDAEFARVVAIKKELTALSTEFSTNIAEDKTKLYFTREELAGTPDSVVKNLAEHDGKLAVTLDMPTYFGVVKNCTVAATRHAVAAAFNNRAYPANAAILTKVIALRHELATLLGFKSYAHLDLDSKMAKTPERAQAFISELVPGLQRKWDVERAKLLADLPSSVTVDDQGRIHGYDINFLINQYKSKFLSVDETALQEHFEMEHTVASLMRIYEAFFDVSFENIPAGPELGLWHDSVSLIRATDKRSGRLLGHIAQDLFPREGKYSHACCYGVVPALRDAATDAFTPAVAVVIANFPKPTADRPSLLMHSDVETYFHEFGHAIHGLLGRSNMPTQSGTRVKRDFVELPSQILEEWMWEPSILTIVGKHHKTGEPLPAALIQSKANSQNAFSGTESLRQLYFASLALRLFGPEFPTKMGDDVNAADRLFVAIQKEIQQSVVYDEETHFTGTFGHLMGYGATYYGYMWSEVFATDVFDSIKAANGLMDASVGRRYGDIILGPGGSRDPFDMLREFLGREPSNVGFLKKLDLETSAFAPAMPPSTLGVVRATVDPLLIAGKPTFNGKTHMGVSRSAAATQPATIGAWLCLATFMAVAALAAARRRRREANGDEYVALE